MPRKKIATKTSPKKDIIKSIKSQMIIPVKRFSRKQIWIAASVIIVFGILFFAKSIFIAATVNGQPISRLAVINKLESQGGKTTLESLIVKTLILNEAKKEKISVSQADVDSQIKTITAGVVAQGSTLDQELAAQGMTMADLSDQVKLQLILDKIVGKNVTVSDKEISDYIVANQSQLPQGESEATINEQVKKQLTQQKVQQKVQDFIQSLRNKAKITNFVNY